MSAVDAVFWGPQDMFAGLVGWLSGTDAASLDHAALEAELDRRGRDLTRQLLQSHLDLRAINETRRTVTCADGVAHGAVETGHARPLHTLFGSVTVTRMAYRRRGHANLCPADAELNLPVEHHSFGLRRLAAVEASRGSFADAVAAVATATGHRIGKRQVEQLTARAAVDIDGFYAQCRREPADPDDVVVLSVDGKGIIMRPDSLRPHTANAAAGATTKLQRRLSKGEKRNRKRMAEVGAVYDLTPIARTTDDVLASGGGGEQQRPRAKAKWLTASVADDAAEVVAQVFDEAERRDPLQQRTWVALVDGNRHQLDCLRVEADRRHLTIHVVCDFVHVLEYLWAAAWCFYTEADTAAEQWVTDKARAVLDGRTADVAAGIRRRATTLRLPHSPRPRLAHRHRHHRGRLPPPRQRPHGHHRRPLERQRRRSRPQAPRPTHQRRPRHLLGPPPRTGTTTQPQRPLPQQRPPGRRIGPSTGAAPNWKSVAQSALIGGMMAGGELLLGRALATAAAETEAGFPAIKPGAAGGETAGRAFPDRVRQAALEENPNTCVDCHMETDAPQVDHAIPRVQGGNATLENAQTTCGWCNPSKGGRMFPVNPPPGYEGPWPPPWWNVPEP